MFPTEPLPAIAERLGAWAAALRAEDVPAHAGVMARRAVIDVVGVAHAGARMPVAQALRKLAESDSAAGASTVIGGDLKLAPAAAALLNAAAAHALDFDANFSVGMVFAPATFVPGLLALGERDARPGRDLLTAFAAASEVVRVLAEAVSPEPYAKATDGLYRGGWFNTSVLGPIGAAVGAAIMLRLDAEQAGRAVAIAASQAGGLRIAVGSDMKVLLCAQAAERGVRAALLSAAGVGAPSDAFEGARGLIDVVGRGLWREQAFAGLGRFDDPGLSLKRYPACSSIQAAVEALELIVARQRLDGRGIARVVCEVTGHIAANLTFPRPCNVTQAQFSMPFAIACLMTHGRFTADMLSMDVVEDPAIAAAMDRVEMRHTPALDTDVIRRASPEATRVIVDMADGRSFSHLQLSATGKPATPMSDEQIDAKFMNNTAAPLSGHAAEALLARLHGLDGLDDLSGLLNPPASDERRI